MRGPLLGLDKKGVEDKCKKDKYVNEIMTPSPPPPPLSSPSSSSSSRIPQTPEESRHPEGLGHWVSLGWDWINPKADKNLTNEMMFTLIAGGLLILITGGLFTLWLWSYGPDDKLRDLSKRENAQKRDPLEIRLYNSLPLRATSRLWGKINSYDLPIWMRSGLYDIFCRTYNCDMSEALESDYRSYKNLSEFFSRRLKPDSRPISEEPGVVSPADGLVLHFGPIQKVGRIEGVKGLNYSVQAFLGLDSSDYEQELISDKNNNELYNCIIYLAPGDYHRFHSPAEWLVKSRKHFPGRLLSVRPSLMKRMPEVLHINERVCYTGSWPHGFFSMTAVGATNVGSIKVNFDEVSYYYHHNIPDPDHYYIVD